MLVTSNGRWAAIRPPSLPFDLGKRADDVVEQCLRIRGSGFDLVFGDVDDVAVVEAVAESVDVVQPAPSVAVPLERVGEALKYDGAVTFGTCESIA